MKFEYTAPVFEIISFEAEDIITASLAVTNSDNETQAESGWWD